MVNAWDVLCHMCYMPHVLCPPHAPYGIRHMCAAAAHQVSVTVTITELPL